ncbi:MAG: DUF3298 domain-containing protein [Candidatus Paceibacterota bacterium]
MKNILIGIVIVAFAAVIYFVFLNKTVEAPKIEDEIVDTTPEQLTVASSSKQILKETYEIQFDFPVTNEEQVNAEIKKTVDSLIKTFEEEAISFSPHPSGFDRPYTLFGTFTPHLGNKYDTFVFLMSVDFGGAHPNHFYKTITFDKQNSVISIEDLVKREFGGLDAVNKISELVKKIISDKLAENANPEMIADGAGPEIENFKNFYIENEEVVFLFEPYAVAAYAYSSQEARIKFSEIKI